MQQGSFLNGKRNGEWTWWYKDGKIKKTGTFKDGIFTLEQKWAKNL
jgi:antitoxin component YwqK of YwqJK toxin-antitoxin module